MFTKQANAELLNIKTSADTVNLFEELSAHHATTYAKMSALEESDTRRQNYNTYKRIAEKKPNILAFATRAISANETYGSNKNGDAFPRAELETHHQTFVMRPHLLDHDMRIETIRGLIAASYWRPLVKNANNKLEGDFVETLIFVNRNDFPKYASQIENGIVNSFSMGVEVAEAECSICRNVATSPNNLCHHAKSLKNLRVGGEKVFEYNRGLNFIEQSAVVSPADVDSHTLYVLAHLKNGQHSDIERLKKLANVLDSYTSDEKTSRFAEYRLLESYTEQIANRVMADLHIQIPRR